jgi:hypothetical protein
MQKESFKDDYTAVQSDIATIVNTTYDPSHADHVKKVYKKSYDLLTEYMNGCHLVIQQIFILFPLIMPTNLKKIGAETTKRNFIRWFEKPGLEGFYETFSTVPAPAALDTPKDTNVPKTDISHVTDFINAAKFLSELRSRTIYFYLSLALFFTDIIFMVLQYQEVFNDLIVGALVAFILILLCCSLSYMAGKKYYTEYQKKLSIILLSVAFLVDLVSGILRIFQVYDVEYDEVIYFPDTLADPSVIVQALILLCLTGFGIMLTYTHAKVLFFNEYKQYIEDMVKYGFYVEYLPKLNSDFNELYDYVVKNQIDVN